MPTLAEIQLQELSAWLSASSQDSRSPMGDTIKRSPYSEFVTVTLDDVLPDLSAAIALGCLPLLVDHDAPVAAFATPEGQPLLSDRAAHIEWLAGAAKTDPMRGFPACQVVRVAEGQTLRQAAVSAGVYFDNPDALLVGIPAACF
ncbi:hypothetical protein Q4577_20825 [Marinovum sp. 2_MG-2023]|uniref:hypothetical protein n=1 Tax=unclassified Marinovum TaxID=2647166 RepID=UPI0026E483DF|nr:MULTISPECIES: hypothetical protein [unclassified Marinovum]MDO6732477.1 hypothetical protein [Marinovum sp. 2_MG-2023]MDO6781794.1 hypothetical protein [Marinovum sp. 1_MG-2023]